MLTNFHSNTYQWFLFWLQSLEHLTHLTRICGPPFLWCVFPSEREIATDSFFANAAFWRLISESSDEQCARRFSKTRQALLLRCRREPSLLWSWFICYLPRHWLLSRQLEQPPLWIPWSLASANSSLKLNFFTLPSSSWECQAGS